VARAEIELEHAEHQLAVSRLRLAAAWGDTELRFGKAEANLFALNKVEDFENLQRLLEQNPDLVRFATAQRLAEARMRLARADRRPNIDLAGGIRYLNDSDDAALVLSASMPLGSRRRAAPAIEESEILALAEPLAFEQRRLELHTTLFEIHQELLHSRTAVQTLRQRIIPEAERALRDLEKGYALGRYSFLELLSAQRTLLDARLEAVSTAADYHRYHLEIERLTGASLTTGATP
jgi:cobalt-zinc-cadmium efflux system outer membrane protein